MQHKIIQIIFSLLFILAAEASAQVLVKTTDIDCAGKRNGKANLIINNAPGPYKIIWSKGSADLPQFRGRTSVAGLEPGQYKVQITDKNNCMIEKEFEIKEPPGISINITSTTGPFDYCGTKSFPNIYLFATSSGGTPPMNCDDPVCVKRVTGPGLYSFTVVDSKGCQETKSVMMRWVGIVCSSDPNDIKGPDGFSTPKWIRADVPVEYTIRFENDPDFATAPAQLVFIEHQFDPKVNPFSLRLGNFGFGDFLYTLPFTDTYFQERLDLQAELGFWVDVVAGYDVNTSKAFWSFQTIDPSTGLPPIDPQLGFLPVNDTLTGSGEGFVTFSVLPRTTTVTGDVINAEASIVFDVNEEIATNVWSNKLDAAAPTSVMDELDTLTQNPEILISWTATDDPGGCGVMDYALYYQVDDGPFLLHGENIPDTSALFTGEHGKKYGFYVIATDNVGNVEEKMGAEQIITIAPQRGIEIKAPHADPVCIGDTLRIKWASTNIDSISISMTLDSGESYFPLSLLQLPDDTMIAIFISDTMITGFAAIHFESLEPDSMYETQSQFFSIHELPVVETGGDTYVCENEIAYLSASGANFYTWSPELYLDDPQSATPSAYLDSAFTYYLTGTDVYGCSNIDSVTVLHYPVYVDTVIYEMCNEDSVFVGGGYQTAPGFYTDSLAASTGCDSTVITEVILNGPCPFGSPQVYVDKDATGQNNGRSWQDAFTDLQDALAAVEYYVDVREIWMAEGIYYPSVSDRDTSFVLRDSVNIYGGFLGIETTREERLADPSLVIISGDIGILNDSTDNVYHVVTVDTTCADCLLDGLTVRFGQADGENNSFGAGLWVRGVIKLEGLVIERNTTLLDGAAIYNEGVNAILTIKDCLFRLNTSGVTRDLLNTDGAEIRFEGLNTIQD